MLHSERFDYYLPLYFDMRLRTWNLGPGIQDLGFGICDLGFGIWDSGSGT